MKRGMSLENLLTTVVEQQKTKRDFVANTKESISMVEAPDMPQKVAIVLLKEGSAELERFSITENCHRQIASRLQIPLKYYFRLLDDHLDLVITQVNALFEREPQTRLLRTLDGKARAFLSDRYKVLDNDQVLEQVLPPIVKGDIPSELLSSNVTENNMFMKILFTGDNLAQDIGELSRPQNHIGGQSNGETRDIVRPGAVVKNSETGMGSLVIDGFFYRDYCLNGCVYGKTEIFNFKRIHLGDKLVANGDFEVFSDETKRKQNELIIAEVTDAMQALTNPENVQKMGDALRATKEGEQVQDSFAAVDQLAKEVDIRDGEKESVIANFLQDGDFSRWGMINAVTKVANTDAVDYERACELEQIGGQLIDLNTAQWNRIASAERVAA
jgi:hypothetical protein